MHKIFIDKFEKIYRDFYSYCIQPSSKKKALLLELCDEWKDDNGCPLVDRSLLTNVILIVNDLLNDVHKNLNELNKVETLNTMFPNLEVRYYVVRMIFLAIKHISNTPAKITTFKKLQMQLAEELEKTTERKLKSFELLENRTGYIIDNHIESNNTMYDSYKNIMEYRDWRLLNRNYLMILKGFSSSAPFFYPAMEERFAHNPIKGGGMYIRWKNKGLVIDPGINFVENMHMNKLIVKDIDYIIITHDHIDHNGDLNVIADLLHQFDVSHTIPVYCDCLTTERIKSISGDNKFEIRECNPLKKTVIELENMRINYFRTKHIYKEDESENVDEFGYSLDESFGIKIDLFDNGDKIVSIGYTSDTAFIDDIVDELNSCQYIIANFSETNLDDYKSGCLKDNHLGYSGCKKLIDACKKNDTHFIISEFWAGKGDIRIPIVKRLQEATNYKNILPGDVGMMFVLGNEPDCKCSYCGIECALDTVKVVKNNFPYSNLHLVCKDCVI